MNEIYDKYTTREEMSEIITDMCRNGATREEIGKAIQRSIKIIDAERIDI